MNAQLLLEFKSRIKQLVSEGEILQAIDQIKSAVPPQSDKFNIVVQLGKQFKDLKLTELKGVLPYDQMQIQQASFVSNLLTFIDILDEEDFTAPASSNAERKTKTGSVLYAIPSVMEVEKEKQCIVRLAFDESFLLENYFSGKDTHIRSIRRIDERMEVEIVDPGEERSFSIRTISSPMQRVDKDDYTEWLFWVKPLQSGTFPLFLKISIIILEEGEKVRKELVLQEQIEVVAKLDKEEPAGVEMKHSGFLFSLGFGTLVPSDADDSSPETGAGVGSSGAAKGLLKSVTSRLPQLIGGLALITAGVFFIKQYTGDSNVTTVETEQPVKYEIAPPLEKINVAPQILIVENPSQSVVLTLESGTRIGIPAGAFATLQDEPVTKQVELQYREFDEPHEIIASGIPMKVRNPDGSEDFFQSAGMFDIKGFSDGQPVKIVSGKSININMKTPVGGTYGFWRFDEREGNWIKEGETNAIEEKDELTEISSKEPISGRQKVTPPLVPAGIDDSRSVVDIDIEKDVIEKHPELKKYRTITWLYAGRDPSKDPKNNKWISKFDWYEHTIESTATPNEYLLTLSRGNKTFSLIVTPRLTGADSIAAQATYQKLLQEYKEKLENLSFKETIMEKHNKLRRYFAINGFGLYNHDVLVNRKDWVPLYSDFDFGDAVAPNQKKSIIIFLITGNNRTVIEFPFYSWSNFSFNPNEDNTLVAILPGNKMAFFNKRDFMAEKDRLLSAKGNRYVFKMNVQEQSVFKLPDLQKQIIEAG